jgi:hypothetical protein
MKRALYQFIVLMGCGLALLACTRSDSGGLSNDQAIDIAAHHLIGRRFDPVPPSTVVLADGRYTVTFTRPVPNGAPGETYQSRVVFDARTREALEIEIRADSGAAGAADTQPASEEQAPRPTPLNEEKDAVGDLQKRLGK